MAVGVLTRIKSKLHWNYCLPKLFPVKKNFVTKNCKLVHPQSLHSKYPLCRFKNDLNISTFRLFIFFFGPQTLFISISMLNHHWNNRIPKQTSLNARQNVTVNTFKTWNFQDLIQFLSRFTKKYVSQECTINNYHSHLPGLTTFGKTFASVYELSFSLRDPWPAAKMVRTKTIEPQNIRRLSLNLFLLTLQCRKVCYAKSFGVS